MNDTFRIALRAMVMAAMTLLAGSTATAKDSGEGSGGTTTPTTTGVVVHGNVFGGGNLADVGGSVTVNMTAGTVDKDVYGGGALANTNTNITTDATIKTTVNLLGGTISGDAYGGGLGQKKDFADITGEIATEDKAAVVHGDINVNLGSASESVTTATAFNISYDNSGTTDNPVQVVKSGRIFGCNNLNGSPLGNVTVTVYRTVKGNTDKTPSEKLKSKVEDDHRYHLAAVYGGGNLADYSTTGKKTHVIINGCELTSILTVYGGGNAAAVPETDVDVYGSYEIGNVFGGGNGKDKFKKGSTWTLNPGANVNGNANTMLYGGLIHEAFGGSNEKGRITGNVAINTDPQGTCTLDVGTIYGAGKNADIDGDLIVTLGCMPENKKTDAVYGGAENANVKGNVELTITSGKFGKVFGGNNQSGAIFGSITLNIMESGCSPIEIDELYLGGNQAAYSVYGYYKAQYYVNEGNYYLDANSKIPLYAESGQLYLDNTKKKPLYQKTEETYLYLDEECTKPFYMPRTSASDSNAAEFFGIPSTDDDHTKPNTTTRQYADPVLNIVSATKIGKVFGGGLGSGAALYGNPTVNINQAYPLEYDSYSEGVTTYKKKNETFGAIGGGYKDENNQDVEGGIFGGGNEAAVYGNTTLNIGTKTTVDWKVLVLDNNKKPVLDDNGKFRTQTLTGQAYNTVIGANITGNAYGGGNEADVTGNTFVNICAVKSGDTYSAVAEGTKKVNIAGSVFGGGKGVADNFYCDKAMVGTDKAGETAGYLDGNTSIIIGNGTVNGSVYGGGEIGRVEMNTAVTIGIEGGTITSAPRIKGHVFGAGKGLETHGYAALVRGNPMVTIQGNAKVDSCVYGGGEIASVARYQVVGGVPVALAGEEGNYSGYCTVNVLGNAIIGPDEKMVMHHVDAQGNTVNGSDGFPLLPDDAGHVFAAGKGVLPKIYTYTNNAHRPKRMLAYNDETISKISSGEIAYWEFSDAPTNKNIWQYFKDETQYFEFIQTLALATQTEVTVSGNAFVKGSVYGGSENGLVQYDTHVTIDGNCQIGCGKETTDRHPDAVWGETYPVTEGTDLECASWEFDPSSGAPYDPYAKYLYNGKYYYDEAHTKYAEGGSIVAKDGHTYYGNVFGGGSGSVPYFDTTTGVSRYVPTAGVVKRDTYVTISGGHILTNVYGGNEATNVLGTAHVTMTGGTIGVPRTPQQIKDHPVTCYLFGAGKGDQRIFFNKETNVKDAIVAVEGGRIYGSVFGGGEDGHVLRNTSVTIGKADGTGPNIGTVGSTYVDGNVFGGGRGFSGEALTAGNVGGAVDLTINGGSMLGSIYGGGRLASVGYGLYLVDEEVGGVKPYGVMREDDEYDGSYPNPSSEAAGTFYNKGRGHITVTVSGGIIGKEFDSDVEGEHSGNVFGGSMGRLTKLDGSSFDDSHWTLLATAKSTTVNINGGIIKRSVYGGGEMGTVTTDAIVNVSGGTIGTSGKGGAEFGNVYGGGKGYVDPDGSNYVTAGIIKGNTKVTVENGTNTTPTIYHNIYGGGAYGSVGTFIYDANNVITGYTSGGKAEIYVTGGTIGTDGKENGMIFGSSRGDIGRPGSIHDKLAWVYDTHVAIGDTTNTTITTTTPLIKGSVYGGGENGHNYRNAYVRINGGTIGINNNETITYKDDPNDADKVTYTGKDYNYPYRGNVYGGGCGTDKYYENPDDETHDGKVQLYNSKAGIVQGNAIVHISAGNIVHNVYGAGAMGSVGTMTTDDDNHLVISSGGKTTITISGGTVGVDGTDNGNVFGAARGDETTKQTDVALVKTTDVTISGDATVVWGNVYGGGQIGCVGTFTERAADGKYIWTSDDQNLNGLTKVSIAGGETKGHVFGAGKGSAVTFKCEKAMVKKTQVSVSNGKVGKNVYGGGEIGRVEEDTEVKIGVGDGTCNPTISGSVYGAGAGLETHGYSALVRGNTAVIVQGNAKVGNSVYGGGQIAAVGRYGLDAAGMPSTLVSGGECVVTVQGNAVIGANGIGNVFGAGMGVDESKKTYTYADNANRPKRMMTYASGLYTDDNQALWEYSDDTHTYVWEYFNTREKYLNFLQTLALATDTRLTINGNASVNGSVYGGSESGFVQRYTDVRILGGKIQTIADASGKITEGNVFGGGKGISDNDAAGRVRSDTKVTVLGGTVYGDVYGGGALGKANTLEATNTASVNLLGGVIEGNAFGGGLGNATTAADVGNTRVNLNGMTDEEINGFSDDDFKTLLNTTLNGLKEYSKKGAVVKGSVFGANNVNGTPKGHVLVHVHGTQNETTSALNAKVDGLYDVTGVFGGGNASDYVPDAADTKQSTEVIIEGCDLTSIEEVYGGGYGAAVPATDVLIKGTKIINNVFGGGFGADDPSISYVNPGANIGYLTDGTEYGAADGGKAVVQLMAGTVNHVYGGSNSKGNIRGGSNVTSVARGPGDTTPNSCTELNVQEIFGGGKNADMFGGTEIVLGCMPNDWIGAIYAGAENADVHNDVSLTLTSGKFERVFGGNKSGGRLNGGIEVNIEESGTCETPIIIGELYAGGDEAPYSIYGYKDEKDSNDKWIPREKSDYDALTDAQKEAEGIKSGPNHDPVVNVKAFTSIGNIFGGGYGKTAVMVGNPIVNINEVEFDKTETGYQTNAYGGETKTIGIGDEAVDVVLYPHEDGKMGVIGNVFGGGNAAEVIGNTNVNIGTEAEVGFESLRTSEGVPTKPVVGANIKGNVYGGGNNASVTGDTNVTIGKEKVTTP